MGGKKGENYPHMKTVENYEIHIWTQLSAKVHTWFKEVNEI